MNSVINIPMTDGMCDTYIAYPDGKQNLPIVLLYMDAIGLRPRIDAMAGRIADEGYFVLAPNLFYRNGRAPLFDYDKWLKPDKMGEFFKDHVRPVAAQLTVDLSKRDVVDFLKYARRQPQVDPNKVGATGYCMGGGQLLRAAGNFPDDFQAVASFHAGGLCTDLETSPHRWFPTIKAEVYIGHADNDASMPPEQIQKVAEVLKSAAFKHKVELYKDCPHGWTMSDIPAYNAEGEQKHWRELLALFKRAL